VIYLCENNQYAMSMPVSQAVNIDKISDRAAAYGLPGVTVDGNDVRAVFAAVREAADHARAGSGPTLVEALTYRWRGHSKSDRQAYRTRAEVKIWQGQDPILRFGAVLGLGDAELDQMRSRAAQIIETALAFAEACEHVFQGRPSAIVGPIQ
jgi:pyruvate dehydrogenase E1 component alpha subunit